MEQIETADPVTLMTETQLTAGIVHFRRELDRRTAEKKREENAALIGRFFKYRNCYSCPQTDADYWWLYGRITSLDEWGYPRGWCFQQDKKGRIEIEEWSHRDIASWTEVAREEFEEAYRLVLAAANARL